jgi:hypothetical protein
MPNQIIEMLDKIATTVEEQGHPKEAEEIDIIANTIEKLAKEEPKEEKDKEKKEEAKEDKKEEKAEKKKEENEDEEKEATELEPYKDLIASEYTELETAFNEVTAADTTIKEAAEKKKKWIRKIDLKKDRLTKYKKPDESMDQAAERALKSDDASLRGAGAFYKATRTFKHKKKSKKD